MRPPTIAVVTGASRGIGAAICRSLASAPPSVPLVLYAVSRSGSSLNIPSIAAGVSLKFDRLDLGNLETAAALATRLQKEHGSIDVLINNAGIYHYTLEEGREEQMTKEMLDVNYPLIPMMKTGSRIVNISSQSGNLEQFGFQLQARSVTLKTRYSTSRLWPRSTR
ncbi:MAG: hypothetical protein LQ352_001796 [Teloschistes flavicans]|nr:MAG: hypothetical protein LQ352_001796 [Teloschistes flavicans]